MATWSKVVVESTTDTITQKVSNTTLSSAGVVKTDASGALSSGTIAATNIAANAVEVTKLDIGNAEPSNDTSALFWNNTAGEMQWSTVTPPITVETTITNGSSNPVDGDAIYDALQGKQDADAQLTTLAGMTSAEISAFANLSASEIGVLDGAAVSNATTNKAVKTDATTAGKVTIPQLVVGTGGISMGGSLAMNTHSLGMGQGGATLTGGTFNFQTTTGTNTGSFNAQTGAFTCQDLTVAGTTTTVNTETISVDDNAILLNNNVTGTPDQDGGIIIERGSEDNVALAWDESATRWGAGHTEAGTAGQTTFSYSGHMVTVTDVATTTAPNGNGTGVGSIQINSDNAIYIRVD
jgi:hypothetical protein